MYYIVPVRMNYIPDLDNPSSSVQVDVYDFTIPDCNSVDALCWFIDSKEWGVVPVEHLVPLQNRTLNE